MGASMERLQALGGWTQATSLRNHYIETSYVVPPSCHHLFSWIKDETVLTATLVDEHRATKRVRT